LDTLFAHPVKNFLVPAICLDSLALSHTMRTRPESGELMGDKSPKAKEKAKKQDTAGKDQKKATAAAKAPQQGSGAAKKGR
jgi:hypothetical protein